MIRQQEVLDFVRAALECSVYVAPQAPGLSYAEVIEAGRRLNYLEGELSDILPMAAAPGYFGETQYLPRADAMWSQFHLVEEPDYRNVAAFDFVCGELRAVARAEGAANATLHRQIVVQRGVAKQIPAHDVDVAITILVMSEHLTEKDGVLAFAPGRAAYPLASEQLNQARMFPVAGRPIPKASASPCVSDREGPDRAAI